MNVIKELCKFENINNVVCRDNGSIEIYTPKITDKLKFSVYRFISLNCLNNCFTEIKYIEIGEQE